MDLLKLIFVLHLFTTYLVCACRVSPRSNTTPKYLNYVEAGKHILPMRRREDASVLFLAKSNTSNFLALIDRLKSLQNIPRGINNNIVCVLELSTLLLSIPAPPKLYRSGLRTECCGRPFTPSRQLYASRQ
jgi:hypothetical protein